MWKTFRQKQTAVSNPLWFPIQAHLSACLPCIHWLQEAHSPWNYTAQTSSWLLKCWVCRCTSTPPKMSCREAARAGVCPVTPQNPSRGQWCPRCPGQGWGVPSTGQLLPAAPPPTHSQPVGTQRSSLLLQSGNQSRLGTHQDSTRELLTKVLETSKGIQGQICRKVRWKILAYRNTCKPLH